MNATSTALAKTSANILLSLGVWALQAVNLLVSFLNWFIAAFKNLAPVIVLALAFGIFFAVRGIWREMEKYRYINLEDFFGLTPVSEKRTLQAWAVIESRLKSKEEGQYKLAVIEADDLFFDLLLALGHRGDSFEDRLAWFRPDKLEHLEDIEKAHALAEKLFDEEEAQITQEGAEKIVRVYQDAFKELGVLGKEEKKEEKKK